MRPLVLLGKCLLSLPTWTLGSSDINAGEVLRRGGGEVCKVKIVYGQKEFYRS